MKLASHICKCFISNTLGVTINNWHSQYESATFAVQVLKGILCDNDPVTPMTTTSPKLLGSRARVGVAEATGVPRYADVSLARRKRTRWMPVVENAIVRYLLSMEWFNARDDEGAGETPYERREDG